MTLPALPLNQGLTGLSLPSSKTEYDVDDIHQSPLLSYQFKYGEANTKTITAGSIVAHILKTVI